MARSGRRIMNTPAALVDDLDLVGGDRLDVVGSEQILGRLVELLDGALSGRLERVKRRGADEQYLLAELVAPRLQVT